MTEDLQADIEVHFDVAGEKASVEVEVDVSLHGQDVAQYRSPAEQKKLDFHLENPELWFPHRYGKQPLYTSTIRILENGPIVDSLVKHVGIRRARLVQRPLKDQPGTSFFFEINNISLFACGSNWIPGHSFDTLLTRKDYAGWIDLCVKGNQDMLRSTLFWLESKEFADE